MKRLTLLTVLVCAALVACEPRGTPQKPKMYAPSISALDRGVGENVALVGDRD